jgi:hypothetical protein
MIKEEKTRELRGTRKVKENENFTHADRRELKAKRVSDE